VLIDLIEIDHVSEALIENSNFFTFLLKISFKPEPFSRAKLSTAIGKPKDGWKSRTSKWRANQLQLRQNNAKIDIFLGKESFEETS
jgi:hypothetical protein